MFDHRQISCILLVLILSLTISQTTYSYSWEKHFGDTGAEGGNSIQQTSDGGYIIAGYTESFGAGDSDVYLIKTDKMGNLQWEKTFGGSDYDMGVSVRQTSDEGYVIVGNTRSFGAGFLDIYLIKTDSLGNKVWEKTFGGPELEKGESVRQTTDGGYIITGYTESFGAGASVYLIKTDDRGNKQWEELFGGSFGGWGHSVQQTTDGGYIITGQSFGAGSKDVYLIYYNPRPNILTYIPLLLDH